MVVAVAVNWSRSWSHIVVAMAQMPPDADATAAALLSMGGLQSTVEPVSYYDPNTSCWTTGNFDQHTLHPCRSPAEELKMCKTLPLPLPPSPCGPPFAATVCNMGVHTVSPLLQTFSPLPRTSQPGTAQVQCGAACGAMPAVNGHTPCFSDAHASSMVGMHGQALFNMSRPHLPQHLPPQASPAQPAQASATPSERVHTTPPYTRTLAMCVHKDIAANIAAPPLQSILWRKTSVNVC